MLPKEYRLTSNYEFNRVRYLAKRNRTRFFYKYFVLHLAYNDAVEVPSKFGIVVSKRLSKLAVVRNRTKRRFSELVRKNIQQMPYNYLVVIVPNVEVLKATHEELSIEFIKALQTHLISR